MSGTWAGSCRGVALPRLLVATLAATLASAEPAFAYIDPGSGSMILQGILAMIAGAGVAAAGFWGKIKSFFAGRSGADKENGRAPGRRERR